MVHSSPTSEDEVEAIDDLDFDARSSDADADADADADGDADADADGDVEDIADDDMFDADADGDGDGEADDKTEDATEDSASEDDDDDADEDDEDEDDSRSQSQSRKTSHQLMTPESRRGSLSMSGSTSVPASVSVSVSMSMSGGGAGLNGLGLGLSTAPHAHAPGVDARMLKKERSPDTHPRPYARSHPHPHSRSRSHSRSHSRSTSPAYLRRLALHPLIPHPRTYTVEAIVAIAHPTPTHALASSLCMSHLLTGSADGYIRDYDVFAAVNGKTFLTAPQRQHCAIVEGTMKAGQLRFWWENPGGDAGGMQNGDGDEDYGMDDTRSPVTSLAMQSDALWALAGTEQGHVNLFTVRHDPGQLVTAMHGHRGHVSSLAMAHDEFGFFSAGWDGNVFQWDLNTGQQVRKFTSHGAQVAVVAVRPMGPVLPLPKGDAALHIDAGRDLLTDTHGYNGNSNGDSNNTINGLDLNGLVKMEMEEEEEMQTNGNGNGNEANSDDGFDPLFDDPEGEAEEEGSQARQAPNHATQTSTTAMATEMATAAAAATATGRRVYSRGPPVLDAETWGAYSADVLMTGSVDGSVVLWDQRLGGPVGRLATSSKTPPWLVSACWSADGGQVYAGRRNHCVEVWDTRWFGETAGARSLKTLRNPGSSGAVTCVAAFPDGRHIAVASSDNIRLWNASEDGKSRSGAQFKIIPGHHGGIVSQMLIDRGARFMVTASSNRGWSGESTRTVLIHDIKRV